MDPVTSNRTNRSRLRLEKLELRQLMAGDLEFSSSAALVSGTAVESVPAEIASDANQVTPAVAYDPLDGNRDGQVSAADALMIINYMNRNSLAEGELNVDEASDENMVQYDFNQDGRVSALDALMVINSLNDAESLSWSSGGWLSGGCSCGGTGCPACSPATSNAIETPIEIPPTQATQATHFVPTL